MLFSIFLCVGAWTFVHLAALYILEVMPSSPFAADNQIGSCIFPNAICKFLSTDPWIASISVWVLIQSLWVLFVVLSQSAQIFMAYTTNEAVNYHRFDYLTHPSDLQAPPYRRRYVNPFDLGPVANCLDFWGKGAGKLKDISWYRLYETPSYLQKNPLSKNGYEVLAGDENIPMEKLV